MGWVAQGPHAQYNISVIGEIERALGQDIGELSVQRLNSGLETIDPSELHAFHAVVLMYEKAATFLVVPALHFYLPLNHYWPLTVLCQISLPSKDSHVSQIGFPTS